MARFNKLVFVLFYAVLLVWGCENNHSNADYHGGTTKNFNKDWQFVRGINTEIKTEYFHNTSELPWQDIALPHTANIEPLVISDQQWQGTALYRKFFEVAPSDSASISL